MTRGRSPSPSFRLGRRRPSRNRSPRSRRRRSDSSDSSGRDSIKRAQVKRRSPPRRPRSPLTRRRSRSNKSSASSRSSSASSVSRSSSHSSGSSTSRSRSTSRSSSSSPSYSSSSASPAPRSGRTGRRSHSRSPVAKKSNKLSPRRATIPDKKTSISKDTRDEKNVKRDINKIAAVDNGKFADKNDKKSSRSRFHDRSGKSISPRDSHKSRDLKAEPARDHKDSERKEISQKPHQTTIHISNISRNVKEEHLKEIFGMFGEIVQIDLPLSVDFSLPRGYARIKYEKSSDAKLSKEHMDGGQIDGNEITVDIIPSDRSPERGRRRTREPSVGKSDKARSSPNKANYRRRSRSHSGQHRRR